MDAAKLNSIASILLLSTLATESIPVFRQLVESAKSYIGLGEVAESVFRFATFVFMGLVTSLNVVEQWERQTDLKMAERTHEEHAGAQEPFSTGFLVTDLESGGSLCEDCLEADPLGDSDQEASVCDDCGAQDVGQHLGENGNVVRKGQAESIREVPAGYWTEMGPEGHAESHDVKSPAAVTRPGKPRFLFAFDFDHTIIDGNSDFVIQAMYHSKPIPEKVKILAKEQGWVTFMQEVFRFHYANNVSKKEFCTTLDTIPLVVGIRNCMKDMYEAGGELIVISDANTFFISHILESQGLHGMFARIIANPSEFDSAGQLLIAPYHCNTTCNLSSRNLCKGRVLEEYVQSRKVAGTVFEFVAFAGDGTNDFCPMLRLNQDDIAFPRRGFSIEPHIERMAKNGMIIKAQKVFWSDGGEITGAVIERLKMGSPHARKYDAHPPS